MGILKKLKNAWRKNIPEVVAWSNGGLPDFVTAIRPSEPLGGVPVFCYHMVEAETFEADLHFLKSNGYRTLSAAELVSYLRGSLMIDDRAVVLTFDDGPRNFYDVAFPLLQQYAAKAVAFIAPGLHADAGKGDDVEARPMNWKEIQIINASGLVEFQSHTLESRYIPSWPMPVPLAGCDPVIEASRRQAPLPFDQDIAASCSEIAAHLPNVGVQHLAFPMYMGSETAVNMARGLGFVACYWGLLTGRSLNRPGDSPFHICRISDEFVRRLPGVSRIGWAQMLRERMHRAQLGRQWRQRYGELPTNIH
ncbi:MAG: polysaccharide deacetylase family protein [Steroidobacteraceae bacterium]